jgi:hypothetical protein
MKKIIAAVFAVIFYLTAGLSPTMAYMAGAYNRSIGQPLGPGDSPTFATIDLTNITDGSIPYMQPAGAGFGDSPFSTDGTDVTLTGGYLGVGVTPLTAVHIQNDSVDQLRLSYDVTNYSQLTTNSTGDLLVGPSGGATWLTGDLDITGTLGSGNVTIAGASPSVILNDSADTDWWISGQDDLEIGTGTMPGSSTKVTVSAAGSIDATGFTISGTPVGTSTDTYWSDVGGGAISYGGPVIAPTIYGGSDSGDDLTLEGSSHATNGDVLIQPTDGNTGIGTTAPDKALEVNSATGANMRLTYNDPDGSAASYTDFATDSDGNLSISPVGGVNITKIGVLSKTADYNVTTSDFGKSIRFAHASTTGTMTLPSVGPTEDGARVTFVKAGAARLILGVSDTDCIHDSTAGATIYTDSYYATITLEYVHSITRWVIISAAGSWTTT